MQFNRDPALRDDQHDVGVVQQRPVEGSIALEPPAKRPVGGLRSHRRREIDVDREPDWCTGLVGSSHLAL